LQFKDAASTKAPEAVPFEDFRSVSDAHAPSMLRVKEASAETYESFASLFSDRGFSDSAQ
jgi:hypothetical protein